MVIYDLCCEHAHRFEGWFSSREDFLDQKGRGLLECPLCGSGQIRERICAPKVHLERRTVRLDKEKRRELQVSRQRETPARGPSEAADPTAVDAGIPQPGGLPASTATAASSDVTTLRAATEIIKSYIAEHFENVGHRFSEEAIAIHLGDAKPRNLTGTATREEEVELDELGVPFGRLRLPRFDD